MLLQLKGNLPFVTVTVTYDGKCVDIPDVLVDTGSGTTILSADIVLDIEITPAPNDNLYTIRGVGGNEFVFSRKVDCLQLGEYGINNFEVEIGGMDYGFKINGILGMDFLLEAGAVINLFSKEIGFG